MNCVRLDFFMAIKAVFSLLCVILSIPCTALNIHKHLKKAVNKEEHNQIRNIDFIYLINLDHRPERLEKCRQQFRPYGIIPYRFSAIYGWTLPASTLNDIGVKFLPGMEGGHWATHFPLDGDVPPEDDFLRKDCYGKVFFSRWMTKGAIGCSLSHLSVLQDAYDAGYETIWVMEDDIAINESPHKLSEYIDKLDALVGKRGWDVLYTDMYEKQHKINANAWVLWRPDMPTPGNSIFAMISEDFVQIGRRVLAHSLVLRRSGLKKILDFIKGHGIYVPYDHELALAPGMKLYCLRENLVTYKKSSSDTENKNF